MKRVRAAAEGRQFRRAGKKVRSIVETSPYVTSTSIAYVKLVTIWMLCIGVDILLGYRLELVWPFILFARHYNEIVSAPNGNVPLYPTTASMVYILLSSTSDVMCYLFVPVYLSLFLASCYIWLQLTFHTMDRGATPMVILTGMTFVGFEYFCRYQATLLHVANVTGWSSSWLYHTVIESLLAKHAANSNLLIYRIFSAHALGFPMVLCAFRLKSMLQNWLFERRRSEVQKANEIFDRILAEAIPMKYEGRKRHEVNSRLQQLALENEIIDFELDPTGSDLVDEPMYFSSVPSIFDKSGILPPTPLASKAIGNVFANPRKASKASSKQVPKQIGHVKGKTSKSSRNGSVGQSQSIGAGSLTANGTGGGGKAVDDDESSAVAIPDDKCSVVCGVIRAISFVMRLFFYHVQRLVTPWLESLYSSIKLAIGRSTGIAVFDPGSGSGDTPTPQPGSEADSDLVSSSGDGSLVDESDRDSIATEPPANGNGCVKRKTGTSLKSGGKVAKGAIEAIPVICNGRSKTEVGGNDELAMLVDKLRADVKAAKIAEAEMRDQIAALLTTEKANKHETQHLKTRLDQADVKLRSATKSHDQAKSTISGLERKLAEAVARREHAERELAAERLARSSAKSDENRNDTATDGLKNRVSKLEGELKKMRGELRSKDDHLTKAEIKLKELQAQHLEAQKGFEANQRYTKRLELENTQLKKALSEENRVKQDLFQALRKSKDRINELQSRPATNSSPTSVDDSRIPDFNGLNDASPSASYASGMLPNLESIMSLSGIQGLTFSSAMTSPAPISMSPVPCVNNNGRITDDDASPTHVAQI